MNRFARSITRLIPRRLALSLTRHLFGLMPDGPKPGRSIAHNRMVLAARYLRGDGIEIGALGRPLPMPSGARLRHVDRLSAQDMAARYSDMARKRHVRAPDFVDDGETLATVPDGSQDFVIASRVLKPGGILFLAIPDNEKAFDRNRPITPFEHLVEDFENGPGKSREGHYRKYVRLAEDPTAKDSWSTKTEFERRVTSLMSQVFSIHFHVWDQHAMMAMILRVRERYRLPLVPEVTMATGDEVIFVIRKGRPEMRYVGA